MEVWLLRHAKSAWPDDVPDAQRPLNGRGEREADALGAWMREAGLRPDWVAVSPARRARQTHDRVRGDDWPEARVDERVYEAGVHDLLRVLEDAPPGAERVLVVGHNPGMEHLVRTLDPTVPTPDDGKLVPTCTLVRLEVDALRRGAATLIAVQRGKELPGAGD